MVTIVFWVFYQRCVVCVCVYVCVRSFFFETVDRSVPARLCSLVARVPCWALRVPGTPVLVLTTLFLCLSLYEKKDVFFLRDFLLFWIKAQQALLPGSYNIKVENEKKTATTAR